MTELAIAQLVYQLTYTQPKTEEFSIIYTPAPVVVEIPNFTWPLTVMAPAPMETSVILPPVQNGYTETCPDGTPAQGSCETPEGEK